MHKTSSALSSAEDRATATGNMHRKFREVWTLFFQICKRTDRDRETGRRTYVCLPTYRDTEIAILPTPPRGEVITLSYWTCRRFPPYSVRRCCVSKSEGRTSATTLFMLFSLIRCDSQHQQQWRYARFHCQLCFGTQVAPPKRH